MPYAFDNSDINNGLIERYTRAQDPKPLTISEVFSNTRAIDIVHASPETTFDLTARDLTGDCAAAVWGAALQADLKAAGCTQAARGVYVTPDGRYFGMVTIFNLPDADTAISLVRKMGPATTQGHGTYDGRDGFVLPLAVPPAGRLGVGPDNSAGHEVHGHFLTIDWEQGPGLLRYPEDGGLRSASHAMQMVFVGFIGKMPPGFLARRGPNPYATGSG